MKSGARTFVLDYLRLYDIRKLNLISKKNNLKHRNADLCMTITTLILIKLRFFHNYVRNSHDNEYFKMFKNNMIIYRCYLIHFSSYCIRKFILFSLHNPTLDFAEKICLFNALYLRYKHPRKMQKIEIRKRRQSQQKFLERDAIRNIPL